MSKKWGNKKYIYFTEFKEIGIKQKRKVTC